MKPATVSIVSKLKRYVMCVICSTYSSTLYVALTSAHIVSTLSLPSIVLTSAHCVSTLYLGSIVLTSAHCVSTLSLPSIVLTSAHCVSTLSLGRSTHSSTLSITGVRFSALHFLVLPPAVCTYA